MSAKPRRPIRGRRSFLITSSVLAGGVLSAASLYALQGRPRDDLDGTAGFGPLVRTPDQDGRVVLALPRGFDYVTFGSLGSTMLGGNGRVHPCNPDGMAAFAGPDGTVRLIRNHEIRNSPDDPKFAVEAPSALKWDDVPGAGGTVTIDYDVANRRVVREFVSLSGTTANCSGGLAYRDAGWISCEETTVGTVDGKGKPTGWKRRHGYAFFVPVDANDTVTARPILGMGRFAKEAAVADNATGIVYLTEDATACGFYRFVPSDPANLHAGGVLQMLAVKGAPRFDLRTGLSVGKSLRVEWVTIDDPDPNEVITARNRCFAQGSAKGGARFSRLEGLVRAQGETFVFVSTDGGKARRGQLFEYAPSGADDGTLTLRYESVGNDLIESPDNLCVGPNGGILFCEDDATFDRDRHALAPGITDVNRLVGLTADGARFTFAVNVHNDSEFAGACFSPDGRVLFVNLYGDSTPGSAMTCAIHGPFERGPL